MAIATIHDGNAGSDSILTTHTSPAFSSVGGTTIVVFVSRQSPETNVTDNQGNTYTFIDGIGSFSYYVTNVITTNASHQISVNFSSAQRCTFSYSVYSGVDSAAGYYYGDSVASGFTDPFSIDATATSIGDLILFALASTGIGTPTYGSGQIEVHDNRTLILDLLTTKEEATNTSLNTQTVATGFGSKSGGVLILKAGAGGDVTAPILSTAIVENANPSDIVLTYDEALDTGSTPATGDFTVSGGKAVTGVVVSGTTVTVTVDTPYINGDTITIDYTAGVNPIQDVAGNNALDLTSQTVTNNVAAIAPTDAGKYAKAIGSGQPIPLVDVWRVLDVGIDGYTDTDGICTEAAGVFTPTIEGYYLVIASGTFNSTHNNRINIRWRIEKNDSAENGGYGSGYGRNTTNPYLTMTCANILYFNGTTDTFRITDIRDTGIGGGGVYGQTQLDILHLGETPPYGNYGTATNAAYGGNTPNIVSGWDTKSETNTSVIENIDGTNIRLKEANRPYLIIYTLRSVNIGRVRTTRISDVTLGGTRITHSAGYAYQRDASNAFADPMGIALVYPTTANQDINIRCWGYEDDLAVLWGTFDNGDWELSDVEGTGGITVIALPTTTKIAIYENTTVNESVSGSTTKDLPLFVNTLREDDSFARASNTQVDIEVSTGFFSWSSFMIERIASSGTRNTISVRPKVGLSTKDLTCTYQRGEQGSQDTKNAVAQPYTLTSLDNPAQKNYNLEYFDNTTDNGANDEISWGGGFFIDLESLSDSGEPPLTPRRRIFMIT